MADIKWIKLKTAMFNDDKIKVIQAMPEGDSLIVIWIRMLILAGVNDGDGHLMISENLPYTEDMLSTVFGKPLSVIRLAIKTFEMFGMIDSDNEGIYVRDFFRETDEDEGRSVREYYRLKKAESREKAKRGRIGMSDGGGSESQGQVKDNVKDMSKTSQRQCQRQVKDKSRTMSKTSQGQCQRQVKDISGEMPIIGQDFPENQGKESEQNQAPECPKTAESREKVEFGCLEMSGGYACADGQRHVKDTSRTCQDQLQAPTPQDIDIYINNNINNISPTPTELGQAPAELVKGTARLNYERISELYNATCRDLPKIKGIPEERRRKIRALLNTLDKAKVLMELGPYERLEYIFRLADESDFLSGRMQPNTWCGFDWLINAKNALKVIEGNYKNKPADGGNRNGGDVCHGRTRGCQPADAGFTSESENDALEAFRRNRHARDQPGRPEV